MAALIDNIKHWSNTQLVENENNDNGMNATKYNKHWRQVRTHKETEWRVCEEAECHQVEEQWRMETERHRAEEQAKKWVSYSWLIVMELMVLGGGGRCITAWQRQKEGIRAVRVLAMPGP